MMDYGIADNLTAPIVPVVVPPALPPGIAPIAYFQPICSVKTHSLFGVEALARSVDAEGHLISPACLFAEAEKAGLSRQCEMACRQRAIADFSSAIAGPMP